MQSTDDIREFIDGRRTSPSRLVGIYLAVVFAVLAIVAVGATLWLSTDTSGTNVLATDEKAISGAP